MYYNWVQYDSKKHIEIDKWNKQNCEIDTFAMYGNTLSSQADWYRNNPSDQICNIKSVIFVIFKGKDIVGFLISNVSSINGLISANINPIVISPSFLMKGHAHRIVGEYIYNANTLLGLTIDYFSVMIEKSNQKSVSLFSDLGFSEHLVEDGFCEYRKYLNNPSI